jgi:MOSC domain-containing protein YiiM
MARIVSIVYTPRDVERRPTDHYARVPIERAMLVAGGGIADDLKGTPKRQLNLMRAETLAELAGEGRHTGPGEMGEQIVIAGLDPDQFVEGTRLRIGRDAVVAIGIPRTGCARFEYIQGVPRQSVAGQLGVLADVVAGGEIAIGDEVIVIPR